MDKPPLTPLQRHAVIQRAFMTFRGTRALYEACDVKQPWFLALTYLGRVKQFYRRAGLRWPGRG
jgi:hypothetical protein